MGLGVATLADVVDQGIDGRAGMLPQGPDQGVTTQGSLVETSGELPQDGEDTFLGKPSRRDQASQALEQLKYLN